MKSLSVAMIVLNEEDLLDYCLKAIYSFKDIIKEVSIVDGFSDDLTLDIIKKWSEKLPIILQQNKIEDFATQRNLSLDKCTSDWILQMDADETFTTNFFERFQTGVYDNHDVWDFNKYYTINDIYHYSAGSGCGWCTRLFKNIGFRFEREVHEYIVYPGQTGWSSIHRAGIIGHDHSVFFFDHTGLKSDKGLMGKGIRYQKFSDASEKAGIPLGNNPRLFFDMVQGQRSEANVKELPLAKNLIFEM